MIITNFNNSAENRGIRLIGFDFSLNSDFAIKDLHKSLFNGLTDSCAQSEETLLDSNFVSRFAYQSSANNGVDQEIVMTLPLENAIQFLEDYREAFDSNNFPYQMHLLRRYVVIKLCFSSLNESHLVYLDRITSQVIKKGGTLKGSRKVLYMISPYLDKRIIGNYNMKVHN